MRRVYRIAAVLLAIGLFATGALGCHTIKGAGKDIQSGGRAIEKGAEDVRTAR